MLFAFLDYDPIVHFELGPFNVSPHGVGIAIGFLIGASFFLAWCRKSALHDDQIYSLINRAAIGSIIGARISYVLVRPGDFTNPLDIFALWKGGISLLGGIAGAVLAGVPKMKRDGMSFWKVMDLAVPCVVMGIIVGRIGDLVVADHLGKPTDFFLGYVCPGVKTAVPCNAEVGQAVHQPALYDLFSATFLLITLLMLRKKVHYDGFLTLVFGAWYGAGRLVEDFFRVDETHGTGMTGSQWTATSVMALCLYALVVLKDTPWASGKGDQASIPRRKLATIPSGPSGSGGGEDTSPVDLEKAPDRDDVAPTDAGGDVERSEP